MKGVREVNSIRSNSLKSARPLVGLIVALCLAIPSSAFAASSEDVDATCSGVLNGPPPSDSGQGQGNGADTQKYQYCQAAKSAQEGAHADSAGYKIWAAVGVVCAHACTASFTGGAVSQYECTGASISGGTADAAVSKNFSEALTGMGSATAGIAANQAANSGKDAAKDGADGAQKTTENKKDVGACMSAATAASQSYSKYSSMKNNNAAVDSNLSAANSAQGATQAAATAGGIVAQNNNGGSGSGDSSSGNSNAPGGAGGASSCGPNMNGAAVMRCAVSTNPNLPPFVTKPGFATEFQKDAGMPLADFLAKNDPPGAMMGPGMTSGMSPSQAARVGSALADLGQNVDSSMPSGGGQNGVFYTAGSGGSPSGEGGDAMPDMGALMQGLMDKLHPGAKKEAMNTGVSAVIFANQTRSPASIAEDRKLSIFDRVTYRYYFVGRRIVLGEGSTP